MRKVIINLSNRPHSEWGDAETEAYKAYNKSNDAVNSIIDFIPLKTAPDADTSIVWGIVNATLECVNKVWSDGAPIAAVLADIPDPVTNHRFVKSCALPCVSSTFDTNGDFVSIREY